MENTFEDVEALMTGERKQQRHYNPRDFIEDKLVGFETHVSFQGGSNNI